MKQVMCITKRPAHYDPHERIQAIGGVDAGTRWRRLEDAAIQDVKRDSTAYYTMVNGNVAWVRVANHNGREYLKTQNDGYRPDNLLALPECP